MYFRDFVVTLLPLGQVQLHGVVEQDQTQLRVQVSSATRLASMMNTDISWSRRRYEIAEHIPCRPCVNRKSPAEEAH